MRAAGFTAADLAAGVTLFEPNAQGCPACDRGFRGRTGIHEMVELTPPLQRLILAGGDSLALAERARQLGYDDLRRAGLKKAMRGIASLGEVDRVLGDAGVASGGREPPAEANAADSAGDGNERS